MRKVSACSTCQVLRAHAHPLPLFLLQRSRSGRFQSLRSMARCFARARPSSAMWGNLQVGRNFGTFAAEITERCLAACLSNTVVIFTCLLSHTRMRPCTRGDRFTCCPIIAHDEVRFSFENISCHDRDATCATHPQQTPPISSMGSLVKSQLTIFICPVSNAKQYVVASRTVRR